MFGKKKQNAEKFQEIELTIKSEDAPDTDEIYPNEGDKPETDEPAKPDNDYFTCSGETFKGDFFETKRRWIKSMSGLTFLEFCRKNCQQHLL